MGSWTPVGECQANQGVVSCLRWPGRNACCLLSCEGVDCAVKCKRETWKKCRYLDYGRYHFPARAKHDRKLPRGERLGDGGEVH